MRFAFWVGVDCRFSKTRSECYEFFAGDEMAFAKLKAHLRKAKARTVDVKLHHLIGDKGRRVAAPGGWGISRISLSRTLSAAIICNCALARIPRCRASGPLPHPHGIVSLIEFPAQ
jgi:hypothetical protein